MYDFPVWYYLPHIQQITTSERPPPNVEAEPHLLSRHKQREASQNPLTHRRAHGHDVSRNGSLMDQ